jgi:hypothetical protein
MLSALGVEIFPVEIETVSAVKVTICRCRFDEKRIGPVSQRIIPVEDQRS